MESNYSTYSIRLLLFFLICFPSFKKVYTLRQRYPLYLSPEKLAYHSFSQVRKLVFFYLNIEIWHRQKMYSFNYEERLIGQSFLFCESQPFLIKVGYVFLLVFLCYLCAFFFAENFKFVLFIRPKK